MVFKLKIEMNFNLKQQQMDKPVDASVSPQDESFNFELWARAVKPQLLAVVQKRTTDIKR
ncbi:MAG TPA: hypothetical protein DEV81_03115 [Cyanobacteria bacterium UBA11049]|nr:hypothetical protein [Cyanobacteria bacterium UBA11049]